MFKTKRREIVTPQPEHLKPVGTLAMLWGSRDLDMPPVERSSMIAGIGLHDRGYGYLDNFPIARRGFYIPCSDILVDTIVKVHFWRLVADDSLPRRRALAAEFSKSIKEQLGKYDLSTSD